VLARGQGLEPALVQELVQEPVPALGQGLEPVPAQAQEPELVLELAWHNRKPQTREMLL